MSEAKLKALELNRLKSQTKTECLYCKQLYSLSNISKHEKSCNKNPDNFKQCPECNKFFSGKATTCSVSCSNKQYPRSYSHKPEEKNFGTHTCKCGTVFEKYSKKAYKCKPCKREYDNFRHSQRMRNDPSYKAKKKEKCAAYSYKLQKFIYDYLSSHPCVKCGENDPVVLEFNHIKPSEKTENISSMLQRRTSLDKIKKEISKCEILCANCHKRHTSKQFGWFYETM